MPIDVDFLKSQLVDIENTRNAQLDRSTELDEREKQIKAALKEAETQASRDESNVTSSGRATK